MKKISKILMLFLCSGLMVSSGHGMKNWLSEIGSSIGSSFDSSNCKTENNIDIITENAFKDKEKLNIPGDLEKALPEKFKKIKNVSEGAGKYFLDCLTRIHNSCKQEGHYYDYLVSKNEPKIKDHVKAVISEKEILDVNEVFKEQRKQFLEDNNIDEGDCFVEKLPVKTGDEVIMIGDLHGSVHTLCRNFMHWQSKGYLDKNFRVKDNIYFIFNGDYVDRGAYGAEVLHLVTLFSIINEGKVFLNRGNHEDKDMCSQNILGSSTHCVCLKDECEHKGYTKKVFESFCDNFQYLSSAVYFGRTSKKFKFFFDNSRFIQANHGGIPVDGNGKFDKDSSLNKKSLNTFLHNNLLAMKISAVDFARLTWGEVHISEAKQIELGRNRTTMALNVDVQLIKKIYKNTPVTNIMLGHTHNGYAVSYFDISISKNDSQYTPGAGNRLTEVSGTEKINQPAYILMSADASGIGYSDWINDFYRYAVIKITEKNEGWTITSCTKCLNSKQKADLFKKTKTDEKQPEKKEVNINI